MAVGPRALLRHRPVELPVEALLPVADAVGPPERRRRRVLRHLGDLDRLHLAAHGRGDEAVHEHRVDEAVHHPRAAGEAAAEERVAGRVGPGAGRRHAERPEHVVVQDRADGLARDLDGHGRGELERQARVHELGARRVHGPRRQRVVELLRAGREVAPAPGEGGERRGPERLARVAVVVREVAVRVDDHARRHAEHVAQRHGGPLVRGIRRPPGQVRAHGVVERHAVLVEARHQRRRGRPLAPAREAEHRVRRHQVVAVFEERAARVAHGQRDVAVLEDHRVQERFQRRKVVGPVLRRRAGGHRQGRCDGGGEAHRRLRQCAQRR